LPPPPGGGGGGEDRNLRIPAVLFVVVEDDGVLKEDHVRPPNREAEIVVLRKIMVILSWYQCRTALCSF
jgi:hypothetical protein